MSFGRPRCVLRWFGGSRTPSQRGWPNVGVTHRCARLGRKGTGTVTLEVKMLQQDTTGVIIRVGENLMIMY